MKNYHKDLDKISGKEGALGISEALKANKTLKILGLRFVFLFLLEKNILLIYCKNCCFSGENELSTDGGIMVFESLKNNQSLTSLEFGFLDQFFSNFLE